MPLLVWLAKHSMFSDVSVVLVWRAEHNSCTPSSPILLAVWRWCWTWKAVVGVMLADFGGTVW